MALTVKDRVRVVTTTTGTSDFTLGGAVAGYQSFSVIGDGNTTYYACSDSVTGDWEVGVGTYSSSGPTLSRDTVLESSNSGSKVSFAAGSKDLFVTYPAERAVYLDTAGSAVTTLDVGTLGVSTANITTANITSGTVSNTPSSGTDIANKTYVDTIASSGVTYHTPVKYEAPNALTATYNNGTSGVGATLTNSGTLGAFTPDGVVASVNDRILIYQQASAAHNGVYTVTTVGDGSTAWVLTRSTDTDSYALKDPNGLGEGDAFFVTSGNTGAGETYICNTQGTITFGTTAINFVQVSSAQIYSAGTGLTLSGTQFSITDTGTAGTYGSASSVPVLTTNAQGQVTSVTNTAISITSAAVSGLAASATTDTTNAANITSGTLPSARLIGSYANITGVGTLTSGTWNASTIGATYGGTGQSSYTTGDLLYASSSSALSTLADVATGNALISGGVGTAPSWGKVGLTTHVSGTLPVASGGTGATTLTGYVYGNGTGAMTASTSIPNAATTATSANTASAIVARDASGNFSAGTITASLSGNATSATSATSATTATNLAGGVAGAVPYQSGSGATAFSAAGTSGQVLTSAGTSAPTWTTPATVNNGTLTMAVSGTGLSGSASFTANQSGASSFTVTSNATNANTASTIVARDASGNFSAGTITATGFSGPLNGTVGATTPNTGAFTTLSATGAISGTGADNNIVLSQNGSTQWRINNSNAGTAAAANLLLQNGTAVAGVYLFGTGYTTNGVLKANSASLYNNNSAGVSIAADNASGVITFASGGLTERARITSSGVFYLGSLATNFSFTNGSAVDLSGSGTGLSGNGTNLTLGVWNGPIVFQAGNSGGALVERARITSAGNVGIGTSSPGAKLDVVGASGVITRAAATQDGVELVGRAGGTTSLKVTLTPTTLTASRTLTLPDNTGTVLTTGATVTVAQGGTGATTLTANNVLLGNGTSAVQVVAPGTNGNVLTSNGTTWVSQAAAGFAAGTAMVFVQTAAPTGWTKSTAHDNKALRIVSGTASSGGSVAFTTAFASQGVSGTVGSTTLATSQIPSHNHTINSRTGGNKGSGFYAPIIAVTEANTTSSAFSTTSTGGGGSHDHSFTGTAINLAVQYVDVIIATKN